VYVLYAGPALAPGVGVGVIVPVGPSVGGVDGLAPVAKHSGKEHHGNHDGVGDNEDQHKDETDDAKHFGLLQFVGLLLGEGLRRGKGGSRNSVGIFKQKHGCMCHLLLTNILMTVAGTRQKSPGSQQRTVKISVVATLVRKAYLGRLVVFPVSVCCTTPPGWVRTTCVYSVCKRRMMM